MHSTYAATAGLGFLLAVLWFDLMFDVQVRGHHGHELPGEVRESIAGYYRRVTTDARPMNWLVGLVMLGTLVALLGEVARHDVRASVAWVSLALTATGVALAAVRTVRNAVRLGAQTDPPARQSKLAHTIYLDHVVCIAAIAAALVLQLASPK